MKKEDVTKYAAGGILGSILLGSGILYICDINIDHTQKICPLTRILNCIDLDEETTMGAVHQYEEMVKDFHDKGIRNYDIYYGELEDGSYGFIANDVVLKLKK